MIDPALLRDQPERTAANMARRGFRLDLEEYGALDGQVRRLRIEEEGLRARRNELSRRIGELRKTGDDGQSAAMREEAGQVGASIKALHAESADAQQRLRDFLLALPNVLHDSVPDGSDESSNRVVRTVGEPAVHEFNPRDHVALGELHGLLDFEQASRMASARFVVLKGAFCRLHRALVQFMLDLHTGSHGYQERYVPYLVNTAALVNTGHLPKFGTENNFFSVATDDLHLIPTAEVSLANLAAGCIFAEDELPLRLVAHSPCVRREAGSYGQDTRGMLRHHQFDKVEMVQVVHPERSEQALDELVGHAERVLQDLELPYRVVELCAGDTSNGATRTFDVEVWLPGQGRYREISSCSNDLDFQARRMQARMRPKEGKDMRFVHILNGSGLAAGRALIAALENCQEESGDIRVPAALQRFMGGLQVLEVPR